MPQITQTYIIKAPLAKVWWALTTAKAAEQWGAGPAKFDAFEGGEFSYWDGEIHGINTKVIPEKTLEQDWYGHDHPEEKYRMSFVFEHQVGTTTIHVIFAGHIYDEQKDIDDLRDYYFEPIRKLLEQS
ncbi:MAG TPA: SRPBCC domain-containing protein [Patescibacteria group bacterium]|jgi:uncharacterized protein YndB with AHSA1/START domain|nr:SRPBCC domain-containing protein [Patescibacteria group bacterium]